MCHNFTLIFEYLVCLKQKHAYEWFFQPGITQNVGGKIRRMHTAKILNTVNEQSKCWICNTENCGSSSNNQFCLATLNKLFTLN